LRLNGWQRIGIVASVIWAIGGGIWGNNVGLEAGNWPTEKYGMCLKVFNAEPCRQIFEKEYPEAIKYHWYIAGAYALVPIPIGWLLAWGLFALVRWIRAGFTTAKNSN